MIDDTEIRIMTALDPDAPCLWWTLLKAWEAWRVLWRETRAHRWVWLAAGIFSLCACVAITRIPHEIHILWLLGVIK